MEESRSAGDNVPLLHACLSQQRDADRWGDSLGRLNQPLCLWLPCEHRRCWVQLQTSWFWKAQRCAWSIYLSQCLGSCSPMSFCTQVLRSFRICSIWMEELSFSICFGKAQGEPSITEPGFVYALVAGALRLLTCCSVLGCGFAPADSYMVH